MILSNHKITQGIEVPDASRKMISLGLQRRIGAGMGEQAGNYRAGNYKGFRQGPKEKQFQSVRFAEKFRGFHEGDYNNEQNVSWEKIFHKKAVVQPAKPFFINPRFRLQQKGKEKKQELFDICEGSKICSDFVNQDGLLESNHIQ